MSRNKMLNLFQNIKFLIIPQNSIIFKHSEVHIIVFSNDPKKLSNIHTLINGTKSVNSGFIIQSKSRVSYNKILIYECIQGSCLIHIARSRNG